MSLMLEPPASLPVDEERGIFAVLVLPWGEAASSSHDTDPGRSYSRGEVHQPRDKVRCRVNFDHDDDVAGAVMRTCSDETGLWAAVKWGRRAQSLIDQGRVGVSAEIDDRGYLEGVALVTDPFNRPGFASAQIVVPDGFVWPSPGGRTGGTWSGVGITEPGASPSRLVLNGDRPPVTPVVAGRVSVVDAGRVRREVAASSITVVDEDVAHDRARHEERMAAFREVDAEHEERMLRAAGVPMSHWPAHTDGRRQWDALVAAQEAEREQDRRRREAAGIAELIRSWHARELVPAIETRERPSWWSRLLRRTLK
jgi:hypothetical protein